MQRSPFLRNLLTMLQSARRSVVTASVSLPLSLLCRSLCIVAGIGAPLVPSCERTGCVY